MAGSAHTFVDEVSITVSSGDGGDGCVGFRREKFVARGGPDGGDGGRGGDVVLIADRGMNTLQAFRHKRRLSAERGIDGMGSRKSGSDGSSLEIRVPVGTLVFDATPTDDEAALQDDDQELLADLSADGDRYVAAKGGRGGWGNSHFATPTRQTPDFAKPGLPGQTLVLRLSLKLLADVGIIGFPNAGKSTLLSRISAAKPKIASYPFTTLIPSLGVVEQGDRRFVAADVPGLIEGASEGHGLGDRFLRHIERTRVLVHLLDVGAMLVEGRDLLADYEAIRHELGRYRPELLERRELVVLSKVELLSDDDAARVDALLRELGAQGREVLHLSSATGQGVRELVIAMVRALDEEDAKAEAEEHASSGTNS